jgi:RING-type zinc-finger
MNQFDHAEHAPRLLLCGHTFCTICLRTLIKDGAILCPHDRKATQVPDDTVRRVMTSILPRLAVLIVER